MKIALFQLSPKLGKRNLEDQMQRISSSNADLVVFPELSLNGYKIKDALLEDAYLLSELSPLLLLSETKDICIGLAYREGHKIYNSAAYFSKGEITLHHKNHLPNYGLFEEARFFFKGNGYSCIETKFGKTAILICEDAFSADALSFIGKEKPDKTLVLANSPARNFSQQGLLIEDNWSSVCKTLALISGGYVLFVNRVGFEDGLGFWGGSGVINPKGEVETKAPLFEESVLEYELDKSLTLTQKYFLRKE